MSTQQKMSVLISNDYNISISVKKKRGGGLSPFQPPPIPTPSYALFETLDCFVVCGGVIEQAAGTVDLPLINGYYRNNMDCRYVFRQPEGKRVALTFTKLNLQPQNSDGKCIDYVQVRVIYNHLYACVRKCI